MKDKIQPELALAIVEVIQELATELDLHYEDQDIFATQPTVAKMSNLVMLLNQSGYDAPPEYTHILGRLQKSIN